MYLHCGWVRFKVARFSVKSPETGQTADYGLFLCFLWMYRCSCYKFSSHIHKRSGQADIAHKRTQSAHQLQLYCTLRTKVAAALLYFMSTLRADMSAPPGHFTILHPSVNLY